jgi:hypothetical protein
MPRCSLAARASRTASATKRMLLASTRGGVVHCVTWIANHLRVAVIVTALASATLRCLARASTHRSVRDLVSKTARSLARCRAHR